MPKSQRRGTSGKRGRSQLKLCAEEVYWQGAGESPRECPVYKRLGISSQVSGGGVCVLRVSWGVGAAGAGMGGKTAPSQ